MNSIRICAIWLFISSGFMHSEPIKLATLEDAWISKGEVKDSVEVRYHNWGNPSEFFKCNENYCPGLTFSKKLSQISIINKGADSIYLCKANSILIPKKVGYALASIALFLSLWFEWRAAIVPIAGMIIIGISNWDINDFNSNLHSNEELIEIRPGETLNKLISQNKDQEKLK